MNYTPSKYSQLKSKLRLKYQKNKKQVVADFKKLPQKNITLWLANHSDELSEYSNLHWYFISQLQSFLFFHKQDPRLGKFDFGEQEEIVFEKWNASEFADHFLKSLNRGYYLGKASGLTLNVLDKHLVTFANRHLLKTHKISSAYRTQTSLGEFKRGNKISKLLETTLHIEGKDLRLMTSTLKEMKDFSQRIETALKVIIKQSPTSWQRFEAFTEVIIPIKQPELVSYSHQDLPGHSMINLYNRDFVDLMDDLLHENGHHHLNYYLNLGKLIDEPIDNIYYSPWRRTLRPLRGIYHAYFTFFWAFKLFADLANAKELDSIHYLFSKEQKQKIYWRAVEEYWMLNYSYQDLKWARKNGLISDQGWKLVHEQQLELQKFKRKISVWEKKIKSHTKELRELKRTLANASKSYLKK